MRRLCASILLLLGLAGPARAQDEGIALGTRAPAVVVNDIDGKPVNLADYIGKKPVLLEFWATWCTRLRGAAAEGEGGPRRVR